MIEDLYDTEAMDYIGQIDLLEREEWREQLAISIAPQMDQAGQRRMWRRYDTPELRPPLKVLDMKDHEDQIRKNRERLGLTDGV